MKNIFKNLVVLLFCSFLIPILTACTNDKMIGMPNPWTDCNQNFDCASKVAGFKFPMNLSNYTVRAMKNMIEVTYPLDENRDVTVRKSFVDNNGDISGDYNNYPIKENMTFSNGVIVSVRRDKNLIYVTNFSAEQGYYSISCDKGMSFDEVYGVYKVIAEVEEPKFEE